MTLYDFEFHPTDHFFDQKILAIKFVREASAVGLREAKDFVEETSDAVRYGGDGTGKCRVVRANHKTLGALLIHAAMPGNFWFIGSVWTVDNPPTPPVLGDIAA
jgi:hypothetical protein